MKKIFITSFFLCAMASSQGLAEPTKTSFISNDLLGDGHDRWRSAGYTMNLSYEGDNFKGLAHDIRLRSEIISPWGSNGQAEDDDRAYAGTLALGVFVNHRMGFTDFNIGGEALMMGDQTGIPKLQGAFHDLLGGRGYMPDDHDHVHVKNALTGMVSAEAATNYFVGTNGSLRPFVSGQYGYETYLRVGLDAFWGPNSFAERYVRDPVSGFLQPSSKSRASALDGYSMIAGIDYTAVTESDFFPSYGDVQMEPGRIRMRLGAQARLGPVSVFYGLTHLTKEFKSQAEGQTLGTLSLQMPF